MKKITKNIAAAVMAFTLAAVPTLGVAKNTTLTGHQTIAYAASGQWIQSGSSWWYRHNDGSYTKNDWEKINGKWYFFDGAGWMMSNRWVQTGGKWYYVGGDGAMVTGLRTIGYNTYYFNSSGAMVTNVSYMIGGHNYHFGSDGAWVKYAGAYRVTDAFSVSIKNGYVDKNATYVNNVAIPRGTVLTLDNWGMCTSNNYKGYDFSQYVGNRKMTKIA
ncbi:MAG: hypothetical protein GXY08_04660 [Ruminococcus sp.]|nr:hypothetical protein [Ruminococcus sp.]